MMRGAILFTSLLLADVRAAPDQTSPVLTGGTRTPTVADGLIKLQEALDASGAKQDDTALSPLTPNGRADGMLNPSNKLIATQPIYYAAKPDGVLADTGVDQSADLNAAMATIPAAGGKLLLPCGNIRWPTRWCLLLSGSRWPAPKTPNAPASMPTQPYLQKAS